MKILLKELINPNTAILNDTQKAVLLTTFISPSEQMAFDNTNSSENMVVARESLKKLGALSVQGNSVKLTELGDEMLKYHNLVDDTGELTDDGKTIMDELQKVSTSYRNQEVKEDFSFLASLL